MALDVWGYPRIDWSRVPKVKRRQLPEYGPGSCTECTYLGLPDLIAFGYTTDGNKFVVGPQHVMYTLHDFERAAGMIFVEYMAQAGLTAGEAMCRAHAMALYPTRTYRIVYADANSPFDFNQKEIKAVDNVAAETYAQHYVATGGASIISVTLVLERV